MWHSPQSNPYDADHGGADSWVTVFLVCCYGTGDVEYRGNSSDDTDRVGLFNWELKFMKKRVLLRLLSGHKYVN